jgi:hypothetical protein
MKGNSVAAEQKLRRDAHSRETLTQFIIGVSRGHAYYSH